jgi:hypothetical protein
MQGNKALAKFTAEKALRVDIYAEESQMVLQQLYFESLYREAYEESERWCDLGRQYYPDDPNFLECKLTILGWTGSTDQDAELAWSLLNSLDSIPRMANGLPFRPFYTAAILARAGLADSARSVISRARVTAPDDIQDELAPLEAYVRTLLGEHKRALDLITIILEKEPQRRTFVAEHPWYRGLRDDADFQRLVAPRSDRPDVQ